MAVMVEMGDVYFVGDKSLNTLANLEVKNYTKLKMVPKELAHSAMENGEDELIHVPIGTIITDIETGVVLLTW